MTHHSTFSIHHFINAIGNRLSLRPPQRDSLEILARVCKVISLEENVRGHIFVCGVLKP